MGLNQAGLGAVMGGGRWWRRTHLNICRLSLVLMHASSSRGLEAEGRDALPREPDKMRPPPFTDERSVKDVN